MDKIKAYDYIIIEFILPLFVEYRDKCLDYESGVPIEYLVITGEKKTAHKLFLDDLNEIIIAMNKYLIFYSDKSTILSEDDMEEREDMQNKIKKIGDIILTMWL